MGGAMDIISRIGHGTQVTVTSPPEPDRLANPSRAVKPQARAMTSRWIWLVPSKI